MSLDIFELNHAGRQEIHNLLWQISLKAFYDECSSVIGYATHYLFCGSD